MNPTTVLSNHQRTIRDAVRALLLTATPDELRKELLISIEAKDGFREQCVAEVMREQGVSRIIDRDEAILRIRTALRKRSGRAWSVTGGKGTAWGWIRIDAPPARRCWDWEGTAKSKGFGVMSLEDRQELAKLLDYSRPVHPQGESVPSGGNFREEFVARAEGRTPEVYGERYWD